MNTTQDPPTASEMKGTSQMGPNGQIPRKELKEQEGDRSTGQGSGQNRGGTNRGESSLSRKRRKREARMQSQQRAYKNENVVGRPVWDRKAAKDQAGKAVCVNYSLGECGKMEY